MWEMPKLQADWAGRISRYCFNQTSQSGHQAERIREVVGQFSQAGIESQQPGLSSRKMHPNAANSLLKVIEEPQSEVTFSSWPAMRKDLANYPCRTQILHFKQEEKLIHQLEQAKVTS